MFVHLLFIEWVVKQLECANFAHTKLSSSLPSLNISRFLKQIKQLLNVPQN